MLSWLGGIFKDPDGKPNWPRVGAVLAAVMAGAWAVFVFFFEHKVSHEQGPSPEQIAQIQKPLADELAAQNALIKFLLEKNPAAGPGAQQAVGAAVQSITQGAAEGDPRLQQALDLLKANKIAEATQLLNAFAEDKMARAEQATAQAEKDRKDAAIAYRNLGAIAGLADPKRALEAYEKALALDPDDVESLYWAGYIQIDYGDLNKAQERLERVQKLAQSDDQTFYKYAAAGSLGEVKQRRGDLTGALQSYRDTIPIIDRLAQSDPDNAGWRHDLSVSYEGIGGVQEAQGDLAGALKSYSDSLAIIDRLAKSDPGNAGWQRDLSVSNERLGDIFLAQGNLPAALEQYRASLKRMVPIRDRDPSNADLQRFTSVTLNKIGDVQQAQGDLAGALKSYSDSLAIIDRLAKSDPGNAGWQRDLSVSYEGIGGV